MIYNKLHDRNFLNELTEVPKDQTRDAPLMSSDGFCGRPSFILIEMSVCVIRALSVPVANLSKAFRPFGLAANGANPLTLQTLPATFEPLAPGSCVYHGVANAWFILLCPVQQAANSSGTVPSPQAYRLDTERTASH